MLRNRAYHTDIFHNKFEYGSQFIPPQLTDLSRTLDHSGEKQGSGWYDRTLHTGKGSLFGTEKHPSSTNNLPKLDPEIYSYDPGTDKDISDYFRPVLDESPANVIDTAGNDISDYFKPVLDESPANVIDTAGRGHENDISGYFEESPKKPGAIRLRESLGVF